MYSKETKLSQYLTNRINDFNANTMFLFWIEINISMRKYKQNQRLKEQLKEEKIMDGLL